MLRRSLIVGLVACQLIVGGSALAKADRAASSGLASDTANIEILRRAAVEACTAGQIDVALSKYQSAIHMAEMAYGRDSSFVADLCFDAGLVAFKSDHLQMAEENLTKAVHINPSAHQARMQLAKYYKARGRYSDAKTQLHKVLVHDPNNLEARELLALTDATEDPSKIAECAKIDAMIHGHPTAPANVELATAAAPPPPVVPAVETASLSSPFKRVAPPTAVQTPALPPQPVKQPVAKPIAVKPEAKSKKKDRKALERERREQEKLARERKAKELQQKKDKNKKNKKGQNSEPSVQTADDSNWGLVPRLRSKAVLLTPVNKKATKAVESTEPAPVSKPAEKPVQASKPSRPHSAAASAVDSVVPESAGNEEEAAPAKNHAKPAAQPKAVPAPVVAPPKRAKGGLVPPPPPVVPVFQPMAPPPPPPPQPKPTKPKSVEKPKSESSSSSKSEEDNPDFLLDWAGSKNKKKGK